MLYLVDKNKELIDRIKQYENYWLKIEHGDIFDAKVKYNAKIVTASNPDFDFAGGLDAQIAKKFSVTNASEFSWNNDVFFAISVDQDRLATKTIVLRAFAAIYGYHREFDLVVPCLGTGIGALNIDEFITIIANLSEANLSGANLRGASLRGANLRGANLRGANLSEANLSEANLRWANLSGANLRGANLSEANLSEANLRWANLSGANLSEANLRWANLSEANLSEANLRGAIYDHTSLMMPMQCPDTGSFTGWKKCKDDVIIKLLIPARARRSSATSRKCRAEYVKVLKVYGAEEGVSSHDSRTTYRAGEIVTCDEWGKNRWDECSGGIHFFITRREAETYDL